MGHNIYIYIYIQLTIVLHAYSYHFLYTNMKHDLDSRKTRPIVFMDWQYYIQDDAGFQWDSMMVPCNNIIQRTPHIHWKVGDLGSKQETIGVVSCV